MRKVIFIAAAILSSTFAYAQQCDLNIGTKTLYPAITAHTNTPAGYQLVFVNHVARHGARHLTKDPAASFAFTLLKRADSLNMLTEKGIRLKKILTGLNDEEHNVVKSISEQGKNEQIAIATRLYAQDSVLFERDRFSYDVQITKEIRTKQTADMFLYALRAFTVKKQQDIYKTNDTTLRFYDLAPAYLEFEKKGDWKNNVALLRQKLLPGEKLNRILARLFNTSFLDLLTKEEKEELIGDVYGFYTIIFSVQTELDRMKIKINPDSIAQFFTCAELKAIGKIDRAEDYFLKGPGSNNTGIQVNIAVPLLVDFINTTDDFVLQKNEKSQFRFSHAETVAPFATLLQLEGAYKMAKNKEQFNDKVWNASKVIPLSANIQWLMYKDDQGNYQLKFLLNEKEVHIEGLLTNNFPFYSWTDVRAFYVNKLQQLHVDMKGNMYNYLKNLK
jgi:hypothetical protein